MQSDVSVPSGQIDPSVPEAPQRILGMRVHPTSFEDATRLVLSWAARRESRYVCIANVHMVMEAYDSPSFQRLVNEADLVTPDGMPLAWMLRHLKKQPQERVYGPKLMLHVCEAAARQGVRVGLYGAKEETLVALRGALTKKFPSLEIVYAYAPPFRPLTKEESDAVVDNIHAADVQVLFVGLGCPKQEQWMAAQKGRIHAVMLGVGAAFDFHAGSVKQAPHWMQDAGMEWAFRLLMEPRRLWKRYAKHNPRFVALASLQALGWRRYEE